MEMQIQQKWAMENKTSFLSAVVLRFFACIFLFHSCFFFSQQKEFWLIDINTHEKKLVKDSVSAVAFLDSLSQNNFFFTELKNVKKEGNITEILYDKGKNYNEAQITLDENLSKETQLKREFFTKNLDSTKKKINQFYLEKGYSFSRIKTKYKGMKNGIPLVEISVNKNDKRLINGFVVKGYESVPKRFIKNLEKQYLNKSYNEKNLLSINQDLTNHPFVTLDKPPQTLFTKDSTSIYLFLKKKKVNSFDGILGFGNDKTEKFTFNGTLNMNFQNMFNGFEKIGLFWQRNPDKGQTFNVEVDIPYFLKSNLGLNLNMNIYRQDSTFANVKFLPSLYYHISNKQKLGIRGTLESSSVLDSLYIQGKDFTKKGIGIWYHYTKSSEVDLFLYKTQIRFEADLLSTNYAENSSKTNQKRYYAFGEQNVHINGNHYLNIRGETALMDSENEFTTNELLRFGGWNSLRGFNENSLYANFYYFMGIEYRYLVGNQAFFDVFGQFGQLNNKTLSIKRKLYSFGLGFNFFLPIGLMSFQISNGNELGNPIKFGDTKIHWGILSRF